MTIVIPSLPTGGRPDARRAAAGAETVEHGETATVDAIDQGGGATFVAWRGA